MSIAQVTTSCTHCGDPCTDQYIYAHEHEFCCQGCANVYSILVGSGLDNYYSLNSQPGNKNTLEKNDHFDLLNDASIISKLVEFQDGSQIKVRLFLPAIHCSSCIYLLENLSKIREEVKYVRVDFLKREAVILFEAQEGFLLKDLCKLLEKIGYPPKLTLQDVNHKGTKETVDKKLWYQLGLAGFTFGNVMLLSFPEYFGFERASNIFYLGYINMLLCTPLLFYGGQDYLRSAWTAVRERNLNIDVPLAIGILTLYLRSSFEVIFQIGEGYFDSFAGLLFFLLIGKYVQRITYKNIDFDRNYRSYFPIGILKVFGQEKRPIMLDEIRAGDQLFIRNEELVPVDGQVLQGEAILDYSFVTGESDLVVKLQGQQIFAGAKLMGQPIVLSAVGQVSQSKLTKLWQEDSFSQNTRNIRYHRLLDIVGKYFTWIILLISACTALFWYKTDIGILLPAVTAVLIVACPCAISMAPPFTYSNLMRLLGGAQLYLKNPQTVESFQKVDHIVFDKTGTLTANSKFEVSYQGKLLSDYHLDILKSLTSMSSHPLSYAIHQYIPASHCDNLKADKFVNHNGKGLQALFGDTQVKLGSSSFIFEEKVHHDFISESKVFIEINGIYHGCFEIKQHYRNGLRKMFESLASEGYNVNVLTGDSDRDNLRLKDIVGEHIEVHYRQQPEDKLNFIKNLQEKGATVLMIGDGLNDAGALKQSDVGIVVSDNTNNFMPACDGVMIGSLLPVFQHFLKMLTASKYLIYSGFGLAFMYNLVGIALAVMGKLSPVHAAILMPLSSISIIGFSMASSWLLFQYYKRKLLIY